MKRLLRILVAADIILVVVYAASFRSLLASIPEDVRPFAERLLDGGTETSSTSIIGLIVMLALLVSWIGLLRFWNPARWMYLAAIVIPILFPSFQIIPPISFAIGTVSTLLAGAILTLIFWSPLAGDFGKQSA